MFRTYKNRAKYERILQPAFAKFRTKYRSHRSSQLENIETNLFKIDLERIYKSLQEVDSKILEDLTYFVGDVEDVDSSVLLSEGLSYNLDGVDFYFDDTGVNSQDVEIKTINTMSSKMSRIFDKVQRLERDSNYG